MTFSIIFASGTKNATAEKRIFRLVALKDAVYPGGPVLSERIIVATLNLGNTKRPFPTGRFSRFFPGNITILLTSGGPGGRPAWRPENGLKFCRNLPIYGV